MKNLGIFYYSSTGNSLYIAQKVKEELGGKILFIPTYNGNGSEFDNLLIVTPIYSFGMPIPVLDLLQHFEKGRELIVIHNYGGMKGGSDKMFCEYAEKEGLKVKSIFTLKMPENFTLVMSPPNFYKNAILKSADRRITAILNDIAVGKFRIPKKKRTKEHTYLKNKNNWYLIGKRFSVTENCTKCGKCISLCCAHNISFVDGEITFGENCMACLGCFHRCSAKAIIYKNKDNKKRYINPFVDEKLIGKDL